MSSARKYIRTLSSGGGRECGFLREDAARKRQVVVEALSAEAPTKRRIAARFQGDDTR